MKAPFLIGLTGGIGSGKSTVASQLQSLGAEVVSGDELGRQALETTPALLAEIRVRFGDDVFDQDGTLRRRMLGDKVFANPEHAHWLTHRTFPIIHRLWREAVARSAADVVVLDAALIFEWDIAEEFDLLLIVLADRNLVAHRMQAGGRLSAPEIEARLALQIPPQDKARRADVVLVNDGSLDEFLEKVREFWTKRVLPELEQRRERVNGS
ncbi:MAG TPA: dephospho-CoA kinase [bacterium]